MKVLRTYKLKITSDHPKFSQYAESYKDAANWLSYIVFKRKKVNTPSQLSKEFYGSKQLVNFAVSNDARTITLKKLTGFKHK